jgi:hypothetical protein
MCQTTGCKGDGDYEYTRRFGHIHYNDSMTCQWIISSTGSISLFLHYMDLEKQRDFVTICRCNVTCEDRGWNQGFAATWASTVYSTFSGASSAASCVDCVTPRYSNATGLSAQCLTCPAAAYSTATTVTCGGYMPDTGTYVSSGTCDCSPSTNNASGTITHGPGLMGVSGHLYR